MKPKQEIMNEETKMCKCVRCDKDVEVNKFANPKAVLCPECDALISARIEIKSRAKYTESPFKDVECKICGKIISVTKFATPSNCICPECKASRKRDSRAKYSGTMKTLPCAKCGVEVEVTKFATPSAVRCPECKAKAKKAQATERALKAIKAKELANKPAKAVKEPVKPSKSATIKSTKKTTVHKAQK